jgi:serine/threonine-protein kinase
MGESEEQKVGRALAETELGTGEELAGQKMPTPIIIQEGAPEEDEPDRLLGKVLGGLYKIDYRIGEGGMGTVYAALHIHLNKHFAIKVLSSRIAADKQAIERLRQEAVLASSIDHDNIVDVVSFDTTDDGDVFIVMELLKGAALADVLEKGPVPIDRALVIAMQICAALHAAHENGIVHRDLKPENIFICRKHDHDFVKVLDFGISKVKSAETEQVRMTKTGQLVGTPLYMSPEQARGEADVDRRVDIYAMGVILYEMLTGLPPFEGGNYFQLLWKHGNEPPSPLSERAPDLKVPPAVEQAIMKALEKNPDDRFATMEEFQVALGEFAPVDTPAHLVSMPSIPGRTPSRAFAVTTGDEELPKGGSKLGLVLGGVALLLAIVGIVIVGLGDDDSVEPPVTVANPETEPDPDPDPTELEEIPEGLAPPGEGEESGDPQMVSVTFDSQPEGATVRVGGEILGTTPIVAPVPLSEEPLEVTFSKDRHVDDVVSVVPIAGARVEGRLRPIRRGGANMSSGMGGAMFKMSF